MNGFRPNYSAPDYRRLPATRPPDNSTTIYSPGFSILGGHPIHRYAHRALSVPLSGRHSRFRLTAVLSMPTALPHSHLTMRSAIQIGVRCSIRPVRGAYRADLAPGGFNTAPVQRAGYRRLMSSAQHQTLRADQRDGPYVPSRRTTRTPLSRQSPGEDRSRRTAPPR